MDGMGLSLHEQQIQYLTTQTSALESQLAKRSHSTTEAKIQYEDMKKSLAEAINKYEEGKDLTSHLTRDMTRQYKGMQDDLLHKINARERTIDDLQEKLETQSQQMKEVIQEKNEIIEKKNKKISEMETKMEDMCAYFAGLIKKSLEHMKGEVEVHSASYSDNVVPIKSRMKEVNSRDFDSM